MFEGAADFLDFLLGLQGKKWLRLGLWLLVVLVLGILVEASLHVISTIQYKSDIAVISGLLDLEQKGVLKSADLQGPYHRLLDDFSNPMRLRNLVVIFRTSLPTTRQERVWSLIAGSLVPSALGAIASLMTFRKEKSAAALGCLFTLFSSLFIGFASSLILPYIIGYVAIFFRLSVSPTAICIWIPFLQIGLVVVIGSIIKTANAKSSAVGTTSDKKQAAEPQ